MKLFRVSVSAPFQYDVYTSALVAASSLNEAKMFIKSATCAKDDFELPKDCSYEITEVRLDLIKNPMVLESSFFAG